MYSIFPIIAINSKMIIIILALILIF